MTQAKAKLLYAAASPDRKLLLNVQTEAGEFSQFEMSPEQLAGLIADGAEMLVTVVLNARTP